MTDLHALTRPVAGAALEAQVEALRRGERSAHDAEVAQRVEGLFAQIFVKELRRGLGDGFFGQGAGSDTFEAWLDESLGEALARDGVLDLAGRIRASLDRDRAGAREGAAAPASATHDERELGGNL